MGSAMSKACLSWMGGEGLGLHRGHHQILRLATCPPATGCQVQGQPWGAGSLACLLPTRPPPPPEASPCPSRADGPRSAVQELETNLTRGRRPQGSSRPLWALCGLRKGK